MSEPNRPETYSWLVCNQVKLKNNTGASFVVNKIYAEKASATEEGKWHETQPSL